MHPPVKKENFLVILPDLIVTAKKSRITQAISTLVIELKLQAYKVDVKLDNNGGGRVEWKP